MSIPTRKLNDGTEFPLIGYGTGTALFKRGNFDELDQATVDAISAAIKLGRSECELCQRASTFVLVYCFSSRCDTYRMAFVCS